MKKALRKLVNWLLMFIWWCRNHSKVNAYYTKLYFIQDVTLQFFYLIREDSQNAVYYFKAIEHCMVHYDKTFMELIEFFDSVPKLKSKND